MIVSCWGCAVFTLSLSVGTICVIFSLVGVFGAIYCVNSNKGYFVLLIGALGILLSILYYIIANAFPSLMFGVFGFIGVFLLLTSSLIGLLKGD